MNIYEREEKILSAIAQSITGNHEVKVIVGDCLGCTDGNVITVGTDELIDKSVNHPHNNFLMRLKFMVHETLHCVFTPFYEMSRVVRSLYVDAGYEYNATFQIFNMLEDIIIEAQANKIFGGWLLKGFEYGSDIMKKEEPEIQDPDPLTEWFNACMQYRDAQNATEKKIRGHFLSDKAKEIFDLTVSKLQDDITDPWDRMKNFSALAKKVYELYQGQEVPNLSAETFNMSNAPESCPYTPTMPDYDDTENSDNADNDTDNNNSDDDTDNDIDDDNADNDTDNNTDDNNIDNTDDTKDNADNSTNGNNNDNTGDDISNDNGEDNANDETGNGNKDNNLDDNTDDDKNDDSDDDTDDNINKNNDNNNKNNDDNDNNKDNTNKEEISKIIKQAKEFSDNFSKNEDVQSFESLRTDAYNRAQVKKIADNNKPIIKTLENTFRKELKRQKNEILYGASGKYDPLKAATDGHRTINVFKKRRQEGEEKDACILLSVDESGSMEGEKKEEALKLAVSITEALKPFNEVKVQVEGWGGMYDAKSFLYKSFNLKDTENIMKMLEDKDSYTPLGFALERATKELSSRRELNKVFIMITDGVPEYPHNRTYENKDFIKQQIFKLKKQQIEPIILVVGGNREFSYYHQMFGDAFISVDSYSNNWIKKIAPKLKKVAKNFD